MSKIHIANMTEANRRTVRALADMDIGDVISIIDDGAGGRAAIPLTSSGQLVAGACAVAMKFSADPLQVHESTVNTDSGRDLGSRILTIESGDLIVACYEGTILEYPADELHPSLNAAVGGTTPDATDALSIDSASSKFATVASGDIDSPILGRVYSVFGTKILIQLVL